MFVWPHGLHVDQDETCGWPTRVTDSSLARQFPGETARGVVVKFSPEGKVLMTLGPPGVAGNPPAALTDPTNVVTDHNGDVRGGDRRPGSNLVARISVFDRNGKFLRTIGKTGTGPGEFRTPLHSCSTRRAASSSRTVITTACRS